MKKNGCRVHTSMADPARQELLSELLVNLTAALENVAAICGLPKGWVAVSQSRCCVCPRKGPRCWCIGTHHQQLRSRLHPGQKISRNRLLLSSELSSVARREGDVTRSLEMMHRNRIENNHPLYSIFVFQTNTNSFISMK